MTLHGWYRGRVCEEADCNRTVLSINMESRHTYRVMIWIQNLFFFSGTMGVVQLGAQAIIFQFDMWGFLVSWWTSIKLTKGKCWVDFKQNLTDFECYEYECVLQKYILQFIYRASEKTLCSRKNIDFIKKSYKQCWKCPPRPLDMPANVVACV